MAKGTRKGVKSWRTMRQIAIEFLLQQEGQQGLQAVIMQMRI